jgi:hypothetical protein
MLGAPRIPDFKIPNSEFCMAYGGAHERVGHRASHLVGHWMSDGGETWLRG